MKLSDLWSPMSDLTPDQQRHSNNVVIGSLCALSAAMILAPLGANAQRMSPGWSGGGEYNVPSRPAPAPPVVQPTPPAPQPTYQPPTQTYQPQPQPEPVQYGVFRPYGPLAAGRVNVRIDSSFDRKEIWGFEAYVQDNGEQGNDQMVVFGPEGKEQIWLNCWVTEEWKSYGPNSEEFIHAVVSQWCGWES